MKVPEIARFCPVCGGNVTDEQSSPSKINTYPEIGQTEVLTDEYEEDRYKQPNSRNASNAAVSGDYTEVYKSTASAKRTGKKKNPLIVFLAIFGLCVVIVGLGFLAVNIYRSTIEKNNAYPLMNPLLIVEEEEGVLIYGDAKEPVEIDEVLYYSDISEDGTKACIMTTFDADKSEMKLWYTDGKSAVEVVDNASGVWQSPLGNKIAYTVKQRNADQYDLSIYDCESGETTELSDSSGNDYFVFSPDGESYAFSGDTKIDDEGYLESLVMYISVNGDESQPFGKNLVPVGISNDLEYLYYVDYGTDFSGYTLYVQKNNQLNKLSKDISQVYYMNRDCSQIIYYKNNSTYLCDNGESGERISSDIIYFSFPRQLQMTQDYFGLMVNEGIYMNSIRYNIEKFSGQLYMAYTESGYSLGYMDSNFAERKIDDFANNLTYEISADGEALAYFTDSGKIMYYADYRDTKKEPVSIRTDEDVYSLHISGDKSVIYFEDIENTLWAVRGEADPEEIAYDLNYYQVSADNKGIFYISEWESTSSQSDYEIGGTLNYLADKEGSQPVEIEDLVYDFTALKSGVTYSILTKYDEEEYGYFSDVYYSQNGKTADSFEAVAEDVLININ